MNVRRLVPVLVAACAIALTPVFAYADAVPKDQRAVSEDAAEEIVSQALTFAKSSDGNPVSMAAKDWDTFRSTLQGLKIGDKAVISNLDKLNKGQIMRLIAQWNKDVEDDQDKDAKAGDEEKSKEQQANKGKHNGTSVDQDEDDADSEDEDASTTTSDEQHGKAEANKHRGQAETSAHGNPNQ